MNHLLKVFYIHRHLKVKGLPQEDGESEPGLVTTDVHCRCEWTHRSNIDGCCSKSHDKDWQISISNG